MSPVLQDLMIAAGLFALLFVALEFGFRAGRRAAGGPVAPGGGQVGTIQGALLGLLGLLLAFSFAAAGGRFLERQDLIVREANAIGTAWLRADLLDEPHRAELRTALKDYTAYRVRLSELIRTGIAEDALEEVDDQHAHLWRTAIEGVRARPDTMLGVLPPLNDVIDLHSTRLAAGRKHLPALVVGLLISCSCLAIAVIGYGTGMGGRRQFLLTAALTVLIGASLWITIDLDHPRAGLLQLSDAPLRSLRFD
jgi:hypothetical protein